jgi:uncharacterized membrane protein YeaQ/YmgE (transglycosylase-associated protein family)
MATFAEIYLEPGGVIAWVVVGLIAGFLAGRVMQSGGSRLFGDLVLGLVGALIGGFLSGMFITGTYGFAGSILIAFLGACLLIWVSRQFVPARSRV